MQMPDPDPALVAAAKTMKGSWKCTGTMNDDKGNSMASKGTIKWALDMDKMWLKGSLSVNKMKGQKRGYKAIFYRTYAGGTWSQLVVGNMGDWAAGTSTGPDADGKVTFDTDAHMGGMTMKEHDFEAPGDKKNTIHIWGEMSMDGKTFMPGYDMTCKK